MKKAILIFVLSIPLWVNTSYGKSDSLINKSATPNSIYYSREWLGTINSINYDRIIIKRDISSIAVRLGFSAAKERFNNYGWAYIFPSEFNLLLGKNTHYFELGMNYKLFLADFRDTEKNYENVYGWRAGYRIQSSKLGLITRIGITPTSVFGSFFPLIDGSIGWTF